jgi:hypothetical protein
MRGLSEQKLHLEAEMETVSPAAGMSNKGGQIDDSVVVNPLQQQAAV